MGSLSNGYFATKDKYGQGCPLVNVGDIYQDDYIIKQNHLERVVIEGREKASFAAKHADFFFVRSSLKLEGLGRAAMLLDPEEDTVFECHLVRGRPNQEEVNPIFLIRYLNSHQCKHWLISNANIVTMATVGQTVLKDTKVPVPPRAEQDAIVGFLDRKLGQIDCFIAAKQRLIALLQEQKTALINRAVTKGLPAKASAKEGLNPDLPAEASAQVDAPMKDSGIDWLGEIPEHWEVEKAKRLFRQSALPVRDGDGVVTCFRDGQVTLRTNRRTDGFTVAILEQGYQGVTVGQLVLHSMDAFAGAIGVSESDGKCTPEYVVCDLKRPDANPHYYAPLLREMARQNWIEIVCQAVRERAPRLRFSTFGEMPLPIPPKEEQDAICRFIEDQKSEVDQVIQRTRKEIELIQELRTTLISDAVTGRIAVQMPTEQKSNRRANSHFCRSVLAAEIVELHQDTPKFGKIKLQKILILAERHLRLEEIDSHPTRAAAGPFDNKMMRSVHAQIERQKWFCPTIQNGATVYKPMEKAGKHRQYFERYWGSRRQEFNRLIDLVKPMSTEQAEIVATLYMAWNDLLIEGHQVTADAVVNEVLNNWDDAKKRISEERWRNAMDWMKAHTLVPTGYGGHTKSGNAGGQIKAKGRRKCD